MLPSGEILVAQRFGPLIGGNTQLVAYPIVAATKTCGTPRFLTSVPDGGTASATDFMLSPDGKEVAYMASETGSAVETRAVKVDGTSAPRKISNLDGTTRGPRFVGAGAFVSFANNGVDAGWDSGAIVVAPIDGGAVAIAASGTTIQSISNCSVGNAAGSSVAFAGVVGVAALRLLRRRRR